MGTKPGTERPGRRDGREGREEERREGEEGEREALRGLVGRLLAGEVQGDAGRRRALLQREPRVRAFFGPGGGGAWLAEALAGLAPERQAILLLLPALGQGHVLAEPRTYAVEPAGALAALADRLLLVDRFYDSIGGLAGYQLQALDLMHAEADVERAEGEAERYLVPEGLNLQCPAQAGRAWGAVRRGLEGLPRCAEVYPLGGAGDRLGLVDERTGDPLPSALLPYCGRSLLESLVRDLQAKEYLYFRLHGEHLTTPVAIMTSDAKGNHERVAELCAASGWFARGEANFTLFKQPMVPMVREGDGKWLVPRSCAPLMKPGGHGVIWKLMLDSGVFGWFKARGREAALLRQISNPLAGTDDTMLALAGEGLEKEGRAFGFASCERKVGASEGCNVVVEKTLPDGQGFSYCVSNIEYTEFDRLGIQDVCAASSAGQGDRETSAFPANTNILYIGLDAIERKVRQGANNGYLGAHIILPGMLINLSKTTTYTDEDTGREVAEKAGRLECTMQNIADSLGQVYPSPQSEHTDLDTFLIYNGRSKVTSSAKKKRPEGVVTDAALRQTPDGSFLDLVRNGSEILAGSGFAVPEVGSAAEYVAAGPNFIFLFHPALGPLWDVVRQKVAGGTIAAGAELVLEIAEVEIKGLDLAGSLLVRAGDAMGATRDGRLEYSDRCGRCRLVDVSVANAGIDHGSAGNVYWQHRVERKGALEIALEGDAEFEAEGVAFAGSHRFDVPAGHRLRVTQGADGRLREDLRPIDGPTWRWIYAMGEDGVELTLER